MEGGGLILGTQVQLAMQGTSACLPDCLTACLCIVYVQILAAALQQEASKNKVCGWRAEQGGMGGGAEQGGAGWGAGRWSGMGEQGSGAGRDGEQGMVERDGEREAGWERGRAWSVCAWGAVRTEWSGQENSSLHHLHAYTLKKQPSPPHTSTGG